MSEMIKEEIRKIAAKIFTVEKRSINDIVDSMGYEDATKVMYYKNLEEVSFAQGLV